MNPARKRKLLLLVIFLIGLSSVSVLVLYALRQNISLFYTPEQLVKGEAQSRQSLRMGGMVVAHTIQRNDKTLSVTFDVTDYKQTIHVVYHGILPDLFREGQGVVATGTYNANANQFSAIEILAKHDENYMPPEVKQALKGTPQTQDVTHAS